MVLLLADDLVLLLTVSLISLFSLFLPPQIGKEVQVALALLEEADKLVDAPARKNHMV